MQQSPLTEIRNKLIQNLWTRYKTSFPAINEIEAALWRRGQEKIILDHFAIIDLPGKNSGIPVLSQLFSWLGYVLQGNDYLPEKQNDFAWMAQSNAHTQPADQVLPQIVVADFRLHELPPDVAAIIEKYSAQIPNTLTDEMRRLIAAAESGNTANTAAADQLLAQMTQIFSGRTWPLPTVAEFNRVHACNELLAWALVFGRIPNHFTLCGHLLTAFASLEELLAFMVEELKLELNEAGGKIKGHEREGLRQGSTKGQMMEVKLADGHCCIPGQFVEFIWRYPKEDKKKAILWGEYYTGFIPQNANRVIESVYR